MHGIRAKIHGAIPDKIQRTVASSNALSRLGWLSKFDRRYDILFRIEDWSVRAYARRAMLSLQRRRLLSLMHVHGKTSNAPQNSDSDVESDRLPLLANILSDFTARSLRGFFFMNRCCESQ
jgi:hypothetical protein